MQVRWYASVFALGLCVSGALGAQGFRGTVVGPDQSPLQGVVVVLLDSTSRELSRSLTNGSGEYIVTVGRPGTYRLKTLRIGYRSETSVAMVARLDAWTDHRIALSAAPVGLDTLRVQSRNACRVTASDSTLSTWAVWEQVRAALSAAQVTRGTRGLSATTVAYVRALDPVRLRVQRQDYDVKSEFVTQPWRAPSPVELHDQGYVMVDRAGVITYQAPGIDALLSSQFGDDHCFRTTTGRDASLIGIAFEPTRERDKLPEIRGTLWIDRKSSELRSMEYKYVNIPKEFEGFSDGSMEFAPLRNGMWAISRWQIRMPSLVARVGSLTDVIPKVDTVRVFGGELSYVLAQNGDTLWARPPLALKGLIVDSSGAPVGNARIALAGTPITGTSDAAGRFSIAAVLPGTYYLDVRTASMDSVNAFSQTTIDFTDAANPVKAVVPTARQMAANICRDEAAGEKLATDAILLGTVRTLADSAPLGALVVVEWNEGATRGQSAVRRSKEVLVDARGRFRFCGAPVNTTMAIRALSEGASSKLETLRLVGDIRFAQVALVVDPAVKAGGVFRGVVVTDTAQQPIADAEVMLPRLGLAARTNERGEFRIGEIAPGNQQVMVRKVGYGQLDAEIPFTLNGIVDRRVVLGRITLLDSMRVTDYGNDPLMTQFAENRKRGFGEFLDREQLAKFGETMTLTRPLMQMQTLSLQPGTTSQSMWVLNKRAKVSPCVLGVGNVDTTCLRRERVYYIPEMGERMSGVKIACYAQVFLDHTLMNPGRPTPPFDVSTMSLGQIEAVEWYGGQSAVPANYYRPPSSDCGVLVIHTRRYRKK